MKGYVGGFVDGLIPRPFKHDLDDSQFGKYWRGYVRGKRLRLETFGRPRERRAESEDVEQ